MSEEIKMEKSDIGEMLSITIASQEAGFKKIQANTEDMIHVLTLAYEHDRLAEENKRLREALEVAKAEIKKISNSIDALDVWIDNESSCAEWVSIDVIRSRLGKMYGRALRLLSELGGE